MTTAALSTFSLAEPIPGYLVRERLGAGGYGEVWKADAPGGMAKAIKIVYGCRDDERAGRELAALNRIKEVRHPFLLSLERIERVDGHLIIVTELASSTLKQEFDKFRALGQAGIPRSELLAHLHDAADALDYISQQHCLQHLDVKPENLLFVGGRIKVADFGLVKDLQDVNSSIVGGMTPVYAAPELFDGRPSNHSDQYSLAIVYQEMLTGVLPYEGRTTAQLAAQHMHSRPRLDRLPSSDEPVIARALAKDPEQRYASCREMVECLLDVTPNSRPRTARPARPKVEAEPLPDHGATEVVSREDISAARQAAAALPSINKTQLTDEPTPVRDLPPLELDDAEIELRPTLFIGIGGVAIRTLQTLYGRIEARFGDPARLPSLQFLLFDTDAESLKAATEASQAPMSNDTTVMLPLHPSGEYRSESSGRFNWLSRRWIYNIPRNLQTQGLRPLGRLALVDNMERAIAQVTRAIRAAADPAGIVATAEATGLPFRKPTPRVFIVSSTTGGTGSGMVLDFGYIVRQALRELQLPDDAICAILAHCSGRSPQTRDLATANFYALLGELNHYASPQHVFPGDPIAGLSSFGADEMPFNDAYMIHLGEELDSDGFGAAVDVLAKYLYYGSMTSAARVFDRCRAPRGRGEPHEVHSPTLRTFGLCQLGFSPDDVPPAAINGLCRALVGRWRDGDASERPAPVASLSDPTSMLATQFAEDTSPARLRAAAIAKADEAGITLDKIFGTFNSRLAEQMGNDRPSYLLKVLAELINTQTPRRAFRSRKLSGKTIVEALDGMIRYQGSDDARLCLESALEAPVQELSASAGGQLQEWLLSLINARDHRLGGAQKMAEHLADHLREISRKAAEALQAVDHQSQSVKAALLNDGKVGKTWVRYKGFFSKRKLVADRRLSEYFELRLHGSVLSAFCRLVRMVLAQVTTVNDTMRNLVTDFTRLFPADSAAPNDSSPNGRSQAMQRLAVQRIAANKTELLNELEQLLDEDLRRAATTESREVRAALGGVVRRTARLLVLRMLKQFSEETTTAALDGHANEPLFEITTALKEAVPQRFVNCGGKQRLLIVSPEPLASRVTPQTVGAATDTLPTVIADPAADMLVCYEVEELPLGRVASIMLDQRFQAVDAASRLHTRMDVPWTPL